MLTQCFRRKKKREKCGIWLARARSLSYHHALTKLLPCNIHAFTSQYQCFSGDFPCFSGGKRPSFFRPFCNALTAKALQNERESRIYARISLSGFHLLINWWFVRYNKISIEKNRKIYVTFRLSGLAQIVENDWYLTVGKGMCSVLVASFCEFLH